MKSHTKKRSTLRSSIQPDSTRLDVSEAQEQKKIARKNLTFSRIWFFLVALLAGVGGIISLRKLFQSDQSVTESNIHYSLMDFMDPPSSTLVTKIQDRQLLKKSWNFTPGNLSYSEIGMLLESPEIVIVENASERKSSPSELRKKGQHVKDLISAGIADSSAVAQAHAITCLAHPAVSVKLFEKPPNIAKDRQHKLAPAQSVAGGLFHASNATIYLFRNKVPYQIVAHELAHCGSAAMGVNGLQLPFSQGIMAKAFPCEEDVFLADARKELQAILKYHSIQEASGSSVLTLAKTDPGLNRACKSFCVTATF